MTRLRALIVSLVVAGSGCRAKPTPGPAPSAALAEAPAPASLVAELSVGNPKETWLRLRQLGGDVADALPSSLPVLFATSLSMPPAVAGSIDDGVPIVGVLLARPDTSEPDLVVGVHVLSGAELVASLTLGSGAKFRSVELGPRLVRLVGAPGAPEPSGALGVSGNYLLIASRVEALKDAGRFVAEAVPRRARQEPGLSVRASDRVLREALPERLRAAWQAQRAELAARDRADREKQGRPPDFADPAVLLGGADSTIESWLAVLESSRALDLALRPEPKRLVAELALTPDADGAAALLSRELVTGSVAPLLASPQSSLAALSLRGDAAPSAGAAEAFGQSVSQLFGGRVTADESKKLVSTLGALAVARRGSTVLAFVPAPKPALLITCEIADAEAFHRSLEGALALLELPPVSAWMAGTVGKPSLSFSKGPDGERRARVRLRRAPRGPAGPAVPSALSLSWQARGSVAHVSISADDSVSVSQVAGGPELSGLPFLVNAEQEAAGEAALALFADARLVAPGGPDEAPILAVVGKREGKIAVSLSLSPGALRKLLGFWVR